MAIDPPATVREAALVERLREALAAKGDDYTPRTALLNADGSPKYINRLILEPSPYLLQHAHNPVDWRPWGEEALAEALERDVPVFLSVGYATCHWCHVMEEESFDNEVVAAVLNAHFIPIKIDREQRPDLDQLYITATHLQQGHAGWPNTVFLRGDGVPFHTGTYFPREAFLDLLAGVRQTWDDKREEVDGVAIRFNDALRRQHKIDAPDSAPPNEETFKA
ncbi:MAG: thioredoxin domain-containing protein, partial [Pseudomonadota bacterium]